MLYETLLNKLKKRRALRKDGSGVTALEVTFSLPTYILNVATLRPRPPVQIYLVTHSLLFQCSMTS